MAHIWSRDCEKLAPVLERAPILAEDRVEIMATEIRPSAGWWRWLYNWAAERE